MTMRLRPAEIEDADAIASIYNEGVTSREATFETEPRSATDFIRLIGPEGLPAVVAELDGHVAGCAWTTPYSQRPCYTGILECSVYVENLAQGRGIGAALCEQLAALAERRGAHKLIGKVFASNEAGRRLTLRCGFREVGLHLRHGRLEGEWRDVVLVERLFADREGG